MSVNNWGAGYPWGEVQGDALESWHGTAEVSLRLVELIRIPSTCGRVLFGSPNHLRHGHSFLEVKAQSTALTGIAVLTRSPTEDGYRAPGTGIVKGLKLAGVARRGWDSRLC
ncbi:hypothetical protein SKAU_G00302900 [Synaphobranchus kaupii]|uniref:Uncharacterized protein n=1 Tax=Synaphobranchus kaupii TaxID=118154 RepID=A0A9Q1EW72_SYNKA|nr:hypothetical protein SKAU_G00302900 [Synaphobranchus kaupii]